MKKDLKIITLESIDGVGISTQVHYLKRQFVKSGYKVKIFKFLSIDSALDQVLDMQEFLRNNKNGIVINDGSFCKSIAYDIASGKPHGDIEDKYKDILHEYECLSHQYGLLNIILLPENANMGQERLVKNAKILGKEYEITTDLQKQKDILLILGQINNHKITRSIEFKTLDIDGKDKILDINNMLWKLLDSWGFKKPS